MTVAAFNAIRARIRSASADADGIRWPDSELDTYIQEAQDEAARIAGLLIDRYALTTTDGNGVYELPSDAWRLLRVLDADGNEVPQYPFAEIQKHLGADWLRQTGDMVRFVVTDFDDWNFFRLVPIPPAATAFTVEYVRRSTDGKLEIPDVTLCADYALGAAWLRDRDDRATACSGRFTSRLGWQRSRGSARIGRGTFF